MIRTKFPSDDILEEGILYKTIPSWEEFLKAAFTLSPKGQYIWRGQRKDKEWPLLSKFDRNLGSRDRSNRKALLEKALKKFNREMKVSHPTIRLGEEDNIWALGQHYGLDTPLLDWTSSQYVAAYFAFAEPIHSNDKYRYVFGLLKRIRRLLEKPSKNRFVEVIDKLDYPSPRFTAQQSIFTKALNGDSIEVNVKRYANRRPNLAFLVKLRIPTKCRQNCLADLSRMNIDYGSLHLDLRDVVDRCKK